MKKLALVVMSMTSMMLIASAPLQITQIVSQPVTAIGPDTGSLTITIAGGQPPYTYKITGFPPTTTDITTVIFPDLPALAGGASYSITVGSSDGQTTSGSAVIGEFLAFAVTSVTLTSVDCFNNDTGTITVVAQGGVPPVLPIDYVLNGSKGPPFLVLANQTGVFTELPADEYRITATSADGADVLLPLLDIAEPAILDGFVDATDMVCPNGHGGTITFSDVTGGVAPYEFSINNGVTFQTGNVFTNLPAGTYIAVIRDQNGCIVSDTVVIHSIFVSSGNGITDFIAIKDCHCGA